MKLKDYLENTKGKSILSSAAATGEVTAAIYSKPHVYDDGTIAFVMRARLTHENLKSNPCALYMFIEDGSGYGGLRLFLRKTRETIDEDIIEGLRRRHLSKEDDDAKGPKFLVHFKIEKALPLIGEGDTGIEI